MSGVHVRRREDARRGEDLLDVRLVRDVHRRLLEDNVVKWEGVLEVGKSQSPRLRTGDATAEASAAVTSPPTSPPTSRSRKRQGVMSHNSYPCPHLGRELLSLSLSQWGSIVPVPIMMRIHEDTWAL